MASDVGIGQQILPPDSLKIQDNLDEISSWTDKNLMKLNPQKCEYMIFSRSDQYFTTRLAINVTNLNRVS